MSTAARRRASASSRRRSINARTLGKLVASSAASTASAVSAAPTNRCGHSSLALTPSRSANASSRSSTRASTRGTPRTARGGRRRGRRRRRGPRTAGRSLPSSIIVAAPKSLNASSHRPATPSRGAASDALDESAAAACGMRGRGASGAKIVPTRIFRLLPHLARARGRRWSPVFLLETLTQGRDSRLLETAAGF